MVVISSADSRVRIATLHPGELNKSQKIVGKVLNESAAEFSGHVGDNPVYYGDEYAFRVSDSLLVKVNKQGASSFLDLNSLGLSSEAKLARAQQALLGLVYDDMNQKGVCQVTQRLAPADIHNYTAPVNGRALTYLEATEFLESLLESDVPPEKKKAIDQMKAIFVQENKLNPLIGVSGSRYSVATEAVSQKANILSQNNRKIMIMKHEGTETYSVHVFIGATGVDQVNMDKSLFDYTQGARMGDMAFGLESRKGKLTSGQFVGRFPVNGSAVQSFYFTQDIDRIGALNEFEKSFGNKTDIPEVKTQMGAVLFKMKPQRLVQIEASLIAKDLLYKQGDAFEWTYDNVQRALLQYRRIEAQEQGLGLKKMH